MIKKLLPLLKPKTLWLIAESALNKNHELFVPSRHMEAAINWLCAAQDSSGCGGVSAGYDLKLGWRAPYYETTGYIIKTFVDLNRWNSDSDFLKRAIKMGDWLLANQLPSGAITGGVGNNDNPIVFNTGQVVLGFCSLYDETKNEKYREGAIKGAKWLAGIQDNDGKWSQYVYNEQAHSYHSEVAWSVFEAWKISKDNELFDAANRNILWVLSNARTNGWYEKAGFTHDILPITHTIGYTLQGLLESTSFVTPSVKKEIQESVFVAGENLLMSFEKRKRKGPNSTPELLYGEYDENWKSNADFSCMTGNCQIAIVWMDIYKYSDDIRFLNASLKLLDVVMTKQNIKTNFIGINGAMMGSFPIWGRYKPFNYPNWAAKYFIDAMLKRKLALEDLRQ
jgi:hypothetical protein